jgi:hypothetical protein
MGDYAKFVVLAVSLELEGFARRRFWCWGRESITKIPNRNSVDLEHRQILTPRRWQQPDLDYGSYLCWREESSNTVTQRKIYRE